MMKRLKAISFYECTQSRMKASQHLLLASPVSRAERICHFKSAAFILELGGISIQSCKGKVHRVCTRRPFLHTNRSLSPDSNEKRPLCVWSSSQSLHAFAIDWLDAWEIGGRGNTAKQQDIRSNETLIKALKTSRWQRGSCLKER